MPTPTLIATAGAINANSFGTRAEADAYFDTVLHIDTPWPSNIDASAFLGTGANGSVTVSIDDLGTDGNSYTIAAVLGVGNNLPLAVALVGTAITVTLGTGAAGAIDATKNTAILVAAIISTLSGITATASGSGADSISVTAIRSFIGGSYREETKIPALIMAQQQITALVEWTGYVTDVNQKLPWPRNGMWGRNELQSIPSDIIPDEVKWAQFELARLLIDSDRTEEFAIGLGGVTHVRAGPITIKFKEFDNIGPGVLSSVVWNLLVPDWYCYIIGMPNSNRDLLRA